MVTNQPERKSDKFPVYGEITGPIVMIGFGSIGKGTLPLIERHFEFDPNRLTVIDPDVKVGEFVRQRGYRFVNEAITRDNYESVLTPLITEGDRQGFCVHLSVDTGSVDIARLCRNLGALYIDTVVEPWLGFYFDDQAGSAARTNYTLRDTMRSEKARSPNGTTAVSGCGANPGMVSWFVKQALVDIANKTGPAMNELSPADQEGWGRMMQNLGVKGVHIAERDTQRANHPKPFNTFWNTWSVEGFLSEGLQPSELGWGTHEKWMPANATRQSPFTIFLEQPGANTRVRTWCPTLGAQFGYLVTHNESVSIADYYSLRDQNGAITYSPTVHYAYHPANDAVLSLIELFGSGANPQPAQHVLGEEEIVDGIDELGVLLYGHEKNAYWYGSQLSIEETRVLAPYQNATGLQVTSAVLAGMVWALENPNEGIVETDEMDYRRCLEVQKPYLGPVEGYFTDWTPLTDRGQLFEEDIDESDPWQFKNVFVG